MRVDPRAVERAVINRLGEVIDPETGADVIRMWLIEDLAVDEEGVVRYRFRPSLRQAQDTASPLCPLAVTLALQIKQAVAEVEGVTGQEIEVVGYVGAESLNELLKESRDVPGNSISGRRRPGRGNHAGRDLARDDGERHSAGYLV